jgi:hypothetical protein
MKAKRLKEIIREIPDDIEIMVRAFINPCGNISELSQVEYSSYGFFGEDIPCVILNTSENIGNEERNEDGDCKDIKLQANSQKGSE